VATSVTERTFMGSPRRCAPRDDRRGLQSHIFLLVRHRPSADPPWMKKFCAVGELEKAIPFFLLGEKNELGRDKPRRAKSRQNKPGQNRSCILRNVDLLSLEHNSNT
jgi:hypothetical protein